MAFEDRKKQLESFVDFSANIGITYVTGKILAGVFGMAFNLIRHPLVMIKWYLWYVLPMWLRSPYDVYTRVKFFKQVGTKCPQCHCWVSRENSCPICGYDIPNVKQTNADNFLDLERPADRALYYKQAPEKVIDYIQKLWKHTMVHNWGSYTTERVVDDQHLVHAEYINFIQEYKNSCIRFKVDQFSYDAALLYYENYLVPNEKKLNRLIYVAQFIFEWKPFHPNERVWLNGIVKDDPVGHYQEASRKKYQKIRCPQCGGFSRSSTQEPTDQHRVCSTCGYEFVYSYPSEYLLQTGRG